MKLILFDFDLTLADTYDMWKGVLGHLNSHNIKTESLKSKESWGHTHKSFSRLLSNENGRDTLEISSLTTEFIKDTYSHVEIKEKHFLNELRDKGIRLGIVTGNSRPIIDIFLGNNNDIKFDIVLTSDDLADSETKADLIKKALSELKLSKNEAVYVGDHPNDIMAARHAGVKSIAIISQIHSKEELSSYNPGQIITKLRELGNLI